MPRKNRSKGRPQARRKRPDEVTFVAPRSLPKPPPVEQMIMPHGRCHLRHGKLRFHQHEVSAALRQAQALRRSRGQEAHMEKRFYECEKDKGGCGSWHLTSRESWEARG